MRLSTVVLAALAPVLSLASPTSLFPRSDPVSVPFKNCLPAGTSGSLKVENIYMSSSPALLGQDLTLSVVGDLSSTIDKGAYTTISAKLGFIPIPASKIPMKTPLDICDDLAARHEAIQCPIKPGRIALSNTATFPAVAPTGDYTLTVKGFDQHNELIACVSFVMPVAKA